MNRRMLGRIAAMSVMLGVATVACTPTAQMSHPSALAGDAAPKAAEVAARLADKAHAALLAHKGAAAVDAAEKAVAMQPQNAAYRMLLGQSYLAAGRFASATTSFHDTLALSPDQPKAQFELALAEIAQGRGADALTILQGLNGAVPGGDLGLAVALAGDREAGIRILVDVVRSGKSDARARQNLALAFALGGHWRESRAMAMQDTAPDRINDQLAGWAELARPESGGSQQVAAMLGVKPASDPGLPTELALATPVPVPAAIPAVMAPVAVAAAAPIPAILAPVSAAPVVPVASGVPVAAISTPVTLPLQAVPVATRSDAPATTVVLAAQQASMATPIAPPALLRQRPLLVRASAPMSVPAEMPAARRSGYVVQLGAYSRADSIQNAWSRASRLMPRLAGYAPTRAEFSFAGGSLVRLSVSGFAKRADAVQLCEQIQARGGRCFVRMVAGDAPLQWTRRVQAMQVASR